MHWVLPANGKNFENEFLQKKNIIWDQWHFAYSTESFWFCTANYVVFKLKQAYSQPATNCGLIEGNLFTNIVAVMLLQIVVVSPGTHLVKSHESQSRTIESQFKRQWVQN